MKKLFIILLSIQMLFALNVKEIKKGDIIEDSIERLEKKYYKVHIENTKDIHITLTKLNADIDLYSKTGAMDAFPNNIPLKDTVPSIKKNDCYSSNSKMQDEECRYQIRGPVKGNYDVNVYILVNGFEAGNYRLEVKEKKEKVFDKLTSEIKKGSLKKGEEQQYRIYAKAGETVNVKLFDLTADLDLRVKVGRNANLHTFDCKSNKNGTSPESCSVTVEEADYVYVHVYGYQSADYSIHRDLADNNESQALITKAKRHCQNQKNSTNKVLCANEENTVYIIQSSDIGGGFQTLYELYKVNIKENYEKIVRIHNYKLDNQQPSKFLPKNLSGLHGENTNLFLIDNNVISAEDTGYVMVMSPSGKDLLYFNYAEDSSIYPTFKVNDSGTRLTVVTGDDSYYIDNAVKTRRTYDISNPETALLLTTETL